MRRRQTQSHDQTIGFPEKRTSPLKNCPHYWRLRRGNWNYITLQVFFILRALKPWDTRPHLHQKIKKIRKYRSKVVRNTVRSFQEIQLTMFEKYSKRRIDPDFLWRGQRRRRSAGFAYSILVRLNCFHLSKFGCLCINVITNNHVS